MVNFNMIDVVGRGIRKIFNEQKNATSVPDGTLVAFFLQFGTCVP